MNPGELVLPATTANANYHQRMPDEVAGQLPGTVRFTNLIADRHGSRVWWIGLHAGPQLALKYTQPDEGDTSGMRPHAAELAAREAAVLSAMAAQNPALPDYGYLHSHGRTDNGTWIAVQWRQNPNLRETWNRSQRRPAKASALMLRSAYAVTKVLTRMHRAGWHHGDLRAEHVLYLCGRARLVDYARSQGPVEIAPAVPYRGGWAPVTAPEIATQLLHTSSDRNIILTSSSEVYTLAAVLHHLWTGRHARALSGDGTEPADVASMYHTICDESTLRPVDLEPAELRHLVTEMLAHHAANRPDINEVCARLAILADRA